MRVLLISANTARTPYPVYPLGISIVAGVLRRAGHEVTLFDLLQHNGSEEALAEAVRTRQPGLVGISIRNIDNVNLLNEQRYIETVRRLVTRIRAGSRAVILLGGCGFSIMPGRILEAVGADYGIVGEGEELAVEFAARIARGERPAQRLFFAPPALRGRGIPSAAYDPDVMAFYLQSGNVASVQTKRGCPHACIYCTYPALEGSDLRPRDPDDVVDDIERLQRDHNARFLFFTDSVFNDREGLYLDVLREMRRRNLNVPWTAFFRPAALDDATIELMKATGLQAVELGSDAASDTTLRGLGKDFLFDDILACSGRFIAHGVPVAHYFMFGCPGETPETVSEGVANVRKLATAVSFVFMGIRILPGTPLFELAKREGVIPENQDLLDPVYYIAPSVDRAWLEQTLKEAFAGRRNIVFPPDSLDSALAFLHKLGYAGSMWSLLLAGDAAARGKKRRAPPTAVNMPGTAVRPPVSSSIASGVTEHS